MIQFIVPCVPVAQPRQRQRIVAGGDGRSFASNYTPTKHPVNAFKAAVKLAARAAYSGPPKDSPICLDLVFVMPRPKRLMWKKRPMPREPFVSAPDADNLAKAVMDGLNELTWRDDAIISCLTVRKVYAAGDEQPHVEVTIEPEESPNSHNPRPAHEHRLTLHWGSANVPES